LPRVAIAVIAVIAVFAVIATFETMAAIAVQHSHSQPPLGGACTAGGVDGEGGCGGFPVCCGAIGIGPSGGIG
jgi:hypothetical protein